MYEELKSLEIELSKEKENLLDSFSADFLKYNSKVNLISKKDENLLFEKHIFDSLAFNLFYKQYQKDKEIKVLDIGTGGGFPSLPTAIIFDKINITAVDSINKKINFIKFIKEKYNLKNITPICSRVEDIKGKNNYDTVVSRAMAELRVILEYAIPYTKTGGYFIAYKSKKSEDEINNAQNALKQLNAEIIDKIEYSLPIKEENKRVLIVIKKTKNTPLCYPRNNSLIKKKPL